MKNITTFAIDYIVKDSLYAVRYNDSVSDEFKRLFEAWSDVEYLESFFEEHKADLQKEFYDYITVEDAIFQTLDEASDLEQELIEIAENGKTNNNDNLQTIFKPLYNQDKKKYPIPDYQDSKVYGSNRKSWLRIYAIRIEKNVFIITGGAIKLVPRIDDRDHLKDELDKLDKVKEFLIEEDIIDNDSIVEFLEL
jgi:hypothetical protein